MWSENEKNFERYAIFVFSSSQTPLNETHVNICIISAYVEGKYPECARKAESCLNTIHSYKMEDIPNAMSIVAKLYSYIGNAAIETRDYDNALEYHQKDLNIGEKT